MENLYSTFPNLLKTRPKVSFQDSLQPSYNSHGFQPNLWKILGHTRAQLGLSHLTGAHLLSQWPSTPWCIFVLLLLPLGWYVPWHPLISQPLIPGSGNLCNAFFPPWTSWYRWVGNSNMTWCKINILMHSSRKWTSKHKWKKTQKKFHMQKL